MAEYDLGTARGKIELDSTGAVKGVASATAATETLDKNVQKTGASIGSVGLGLVGFGVAAVGVFGLAVNAAADFEAKLSEFKAVSHATEDQLQAISDKALQLGADTSFSAGEAADAMNELAKSGLGVEDILNGAADATTYLAAAGSIALPEAASIISAALNQFKLEAAELPKVADLLAGAANASATGVSEVGLALSYVGPVAQAAGLSIEDTAGAISLLANNGIDAQKAGTGLRGILSSLQPNSDKAATAMKELGLITADGSNQFFDATGKIKPFNEIVGILNKSMGGLTEQQRLAYSETIFGREQLAAINAVAGTTQQEFLDLQGVIGNTSAQEVANTKLDNLSGSIEELKGTAETFLIKAGTPFLAGIRAIVDAFTSWINWFGKLNPEILKWIGYGVAAAGALALLVGGVLLAISAIEKVKLAFGALNTVMSANPIALVILAVAALAAGLKWLYDNNETFRQGVDKLWESFGPIWDAILAKAQEVWGWLATNVPPIWDRIKEAISTAWNWVLTNIWPSVEAFGNFLVEKFGAAVDWITNTFVPNFTAGWDAIVGAMRDARDYVVNELIPKVQEIWGKVQPGLEAIRAFIDDKLGGAFGGVGDKVSELTSTIATKFSDGTISTAISDANAAIVGGLQSAWSWITETLIPALTSLATAAQTQFAAFAGWFNEHMGPVIGALGELWNAIWQKAQEAWDQLWPILEFAGKALAVIIGAIVLAALWIWENFGDEIIATLQSAWETVKSVVEAALKVIQGIIEVVTGIISGDWGKVWDGVKNILAGVWDAIWAIIEGVMTRVKIFLDGAMETLKEVFSAAWQWIVDNGPQKLGELLEWFRNLPGEILKAIGNALYDAGKSIFEGLMNGMRDKWNEITSWLSGLNPANFKGPEKRDRKMLVDNGEAIMAGLQAGMSDGWDQASKWLTTIAPTLNVGTPGGASAVAGMSGPTNVNIYLGDRKLSKAETSEVFDSSLLTQITEAARAGQR